MSIRNGLRVAVDRADLDATERTRSANRALRERLGVWKRQLRTFVKFGGLVCRVHPESSYKPLREATCGFCTARAVRGDRLHVLFTESHETDTYHVLCACCEECIATCVVPNMIVVLEDGMGYGVSLVVHMHVDDVEL